MWTPRLRWIPEHWMHTKIPKFTLAHLGPLPKKAMNSVRFIPLHTEYGLFGNTDFLLLHPDWLSAQLLFHLNMLLSIFILQKGSTSKRVISSCKEKAKDSTYLLLQSAHSLFSGNFMRASSTCFAKRISGWTCGHVSLHAPQFQLEHATWDLLFGKARRPSFISFDTFFTRTDLYNQKPWRLIKRQ